MMPDLPDFITSVWAARGNDFQQAYDIYTELGRKKYIYWLITTGAQEYPIFIKEVRDWLSQNLHSLDATSLDGAPHLTALVDLIAQEYPGIESDPSSSTSVWRWYLSGGYRLYGFETGMPTITGTHTRTESFGYSIPIEARFHSWSFGSEGSGIEIFRAYLQQAWAFASDAKFPLENFAVNALSCYSPDGQPSHALRAFLQNLHFLKDADFSRSELETTSWWDEGGHALYGLAEQQIRNLIVYSLSQKADSCADKSLVSLSSTKKADANVLSQKKIALIGYPKGEFGIGEDIRLLSESLSSAGLASQMYRSPGPLVARENIDVSSSPIDDETIQSDLKFFAMPAFDTLALYHRCGRQLFQQSEGKLKIGFWPWEFDRFPDEASFAFELVDIVWCHSDHSLAAFTSHTNKPVIKVPLPVMVPEVPPADRSKLCIKKDTFLFFTSFDGASAIARKNPLGAINAFTQAFSRQDDVMLIVKAMNQDMTCALWRECLRKIHCDPRILLIDQTLGRNEYYSILKSADAVISLHRAEGFGRLMAESMALGLPTIASRYSGNLDFMNDENSWLVDGRTTSVLRGDYPFYRGQKWFEPDLSSAVDALRHCYSSITEREIRGSSAFATMKRYSPEVCGQFYLGQLV